MSIPEADYDGAWKEALEAYLPECLALLAPDIHAAIDWSPGITFLDTELQSITGTAAIGVRAVDKLARVWRRDGHEAWVLIHIEAQHQRDDGLQRRVFTYYTRLLDQYNQPVISLVILGDAAAGWRPDSWETELWGCGVRFWFPIVKLVDFRDRLAELSSEHNPFAAVVLAHLAAVATQRDAPARQRVKFAQVRRLYELGYEREEILRLFRLIDWLFCGCRRGWIGPSCRMCGPTKRSERCRISAVSSESRLRKGSSRGLREADERDYWLGWP